MVIPRSIEQFFLIYVHVYLRVLKNIRLSFSKTHPIKRENNNIINYSNKTQVGVSSIYLESTFTKCIAEIYVGNSRSISRINWTTPWFTRNRVVSKFYFLHRIFFSLWLYKFKTFVVVLIHTRFYSLFEIRLLDKRI